MDELAIIYLVQLDEFRAGFALSERKPDRKRI